MKALIVVLVIAVVLGLAGCASQASIKSSVDSFNELLKAQADLLEARLHGDTVKIAALEKKVVDLKAESDAAIAEVAKSAEENAKAASDSAMTILAAIGTIVTGVGGLWYRKKLINTPVPEQ